MRITSHLLPPTALIPNSSYPLLHYEQVYASDELDPLMLFDKFEEKGWAPQWLWRYGPETESHYHSRTHEAMIVLCGQATIRFGVEDTSSEGLLLTAKPGDAFLIPAGVSHKTYVENPNAQVKLLTPGDGHGFRKQDLEGVTVEGFCMLGAYPRGMEWDFCVGGETNREESDEVPKPRMDPCLGAEGGIMELWK